MDIEILGSLLAFAAMIITWAAAPGGKEKSSAAASKVPATN